MIGNSNETDIVDALAELRVVPVATLDPASAERVGSTLVAAGLPCLEIAYRSDDATEAISQARNVPGLLVGAGTILEPAQAVAAAAAGAAFAVSPVLDTAIVERCRELGLPFFPGVATPTEITRARQLGLRALKVFPIASLGGVGFLHALGSVFPDVGFIPTGGVNPSNLGDYLALPNVLACGGSWLIQGRDGDSADLAVRIQQALERAS